MFTYLADYVKAKEYHEKAVAIAIKIDDKHEEGSCYQNLGTLFTYLADYVKAKNIMRKHLRSQLKSVTDMEKEHVIKT